MHGRGRWRGAGSQVELECMSIRSCVPNVAGCLSTWLTMWFGGGLCLYMWMQWDRTSTVDPCRSLGWGMDGVQNVSMVAERGWRRCWGKSHVEIKITCHTRLMWLGACMLALFRVSTYSSWVGFVYVDEMWDRTSVDLWLGHGSCAVRKYG